ncbi:hypothetical protein [Kordia sp.]|uniref:hypothetical protein n=1 Tax=Kordia sp. TaxID=1965332 RepID=UPI0025BA3A38|nr:hypothetical protein [Kordia sp.]MCH2193006.1 hypothetical protein [Kordia sp.]
MKIKHIKIVFLSLVLIGLHSCSKDEAFEGDDPVAVDQLDVSKQSLEDQALFEYARLMSVAIQKHANMNNLLQEEAIRLQRRGYYEQEFFVGMQGKSEMKGFAGKSLNQILANIDEAKSNVNIKEFLNVNPGMSVLLAGDRRTEEFSNRVYVDNGFDDSNPNEVVHYYENGVMYSELLTVERYKKSFVVRISEVYTGITTGSLDKSDKNNSVLFTYDDGRSVVVNAGSIETVNSKLLANEDPSLDGVEGDDIIYPGGGGNTGGGGSPGGGSGNPPSSGCDEDCERDCEDGTENLWRFRTSNDYDGFLAGKGEWFFVIIWADGANYTIEDGAVVTSGSALSYLRTGQITKVTDDDTWFYPNFSSIIWDPHVSATNPKPDGNRMKVACFESDGGRTKNFETKLSFKVFETIDVELPINFTINNGDDFIGEYIVEYCHDIGSGGFIYHPASAVDVQHNER